MNTEKIVNAEKIASAEKIANAEKKDSDCGGVACAGWVSVHGENGA